MRQVCITNKARLHRRNNLVCSRRFIKPNSRNDKFIATGKQCKPISKTPQSSLYLFETKYKTLLWNDVTQCKYYSAFPHTNQKGVLMFEDIDTESFILWGAEFLLNQVEAKSQSISIAISWLCCEEFILVN